MASGTDPLLSWFVAEGARPAPAYAAALTEVASAACSLGELTMRVTGNAAVAAAAQLGAIPRTPEQADPDARRPSTEPTLLARPAPMRR